jgi:hypothetical protein
MGSYHFGWEKPGSACLARLIRENAYPNAGGNVNLSAFDRMRFHYPLHHSPGRVSSVFRMSNVLEQYYKFVAALTADGVRRAIL